MGVMNGFDMSNCYYPLQVPSQCEYKYLLRVVLIFTGYKTNKHLVFMLISGHIATIIKIPKNCE